MELYHIHILGNHDRLYKVNSEFTIDKNTYNNRIYTRVNNLTPTVDVDRYPELVNYLNELVLRAGMSPYETKINIGELIDLFLGLYISEKDNTKLDNNLPEGANIDLVKILKDASRATLEESTIIREIAMEEYRKENCVSLPSRMHSLFACDEEGLDYWGKFVFDVDKNTQVFRIEAMNEPFVSNESLLPAEVLSYGDKIKESYKYFHPKAKDLNPRTNEYLVQGKIKIKERLM